VQFNATLAQALAQLDQSHPDLRLLSPDAFAVFSAFLDHPADYGLTKTYPAAWQDPALTNKSFQGPGANYVFWDEYGHPTAKAHAIIAARFLEALLEARPEKLSIARASGGLGLKMEKLLTGREYSLQASTNLVDWKEVATFRAQSGTNDIPAPVLTGPSAYFRLAYYEP
jgi:phospholipase/lecithinase/hemolysin